MGLDDRIGTTIGRESFCANCFADKARTAVTVIAQNRARAPDWPTTLANLAGLALFAADALFLESCASYWMAERTRPVASIELGVSGLGQQLLRFATEPRP